ncbi:hypothetical protein ACFE04_012849 [Oxalis oulophora]
MPPRKTKPDAPAASTSSNPGHKLLLFEALREGLEEEMEKDPTVRVMSEDVGHYGGSYKVTKELANKFGDLCVLNPPIAENSFTGMGIGAAMTGLRPIVEGNEHGTSSFSFQPNFQYLWHAPLYNPADSSKPYAICGLGLVGKEVSLATKSDSTMGRDEEVYTAAFVTSKKLFLLSVTYSNRRALSTTRVDGHVNGDQYEEHMVEDAEINVNGGGNGHKKRRTSVVWDYFDYVGMELSLIESFPSRRLVSPRRSSCCGCERNALSPREGNREVGRENKRLYYVRLDMIDCGGGWRR